MRSALIVADIVEPCDRAIFPVGCDALASRLIVAGGIAVMLAGTTPDRGRNKRRRGSFDL